MIKQLFSIGIALSLFSQMLWAQWTPVGDRIKTSWAEKIDVNNVLPEYPRPIMERSEWSNLNMEVCSFTVGKINSGFF